MSAYQMSPATDRCAVSDSPHSQPARRSPRHPRASRDNHPTSQGGRTVSGGSQDCGYNQGGCRGTKRHSYSRPCCPVMIEPDASLRKIPASDLKPLAADVGPRVDICGCTLEYDATVTHDVK